MALARGRIAPADPNRDIIPGEPVHLQSRRRQQRFLFGLARMPYGELTTDCRIRVTNQPYDILVRSNHGCGIDEEEGIMANKNGVTSLTETVLSNHVIWLTLGRYLSFADLKTCRLVCHSMNNQILDSTNFKDRAHVTLTPQLLRLEEFGSTTVSWKHIAIPVQRVCERSECAQSHLHDLCWIIPMLREVQSLTLLKGPPCAKNIAAISPSQSVMLKASNKLRALTVDEELLYSSVFKKCSAQLSSLVSFKIATNNGMCCPLPLYAVQDMLNVTKNLKVFKSSFQMNSQAHPYSSVSNIEIMSLLIKQNVSTLQVLKPRDPLIWTRVGFLEYQPISGLVFPLLTSVRIYLTSWNANDVKEFIKCQPKLTHLTLDSSATVDGVLLRSMLNSVAAISGRLEKLDVKAGHLRCSSILDWKFLESSTIQDISIWPWNCRLYADQATPGSQFVPLVLNYLPQNVKRVRLQSSFVDLNSDIRDQDIYLGRIDPGMLTSLCLSRMADFISDRTLEYIFRNFLMLRELHLSHLDHKVTEFGFTGICLQSPLSEFSIENLKGLQSLTIRRCKAISNFSLLRAFRFQELQFLDLSGNPNINLQGCIAVAQQNPSLEVFINDHMSEFPLQESVRRKHFPRLKSLQNWLIEQD